LWPQSYKRYFGHIAWKSIEDLRKTAGSSQPKRSFYDKLELDEFWTYVGKKSHKQWLLYAYHRKNGEIVAWAFGKCNEKKVSALWK